MSDLTHREEIELHLKAKLDEAQRQLRGASPQEKDEALQSFKEALRNFTAVVIEGKYRLHLVPKPPARVD